MIFARSKKTDIINSKLNFIMTYIRFIITPSSDVVHVMKAAFLMEDHLFGGTIVQSLLIPNDTICFTTVPPSQFLD